MEQRTEGECVDGDGAPPDEFRSGSPEGRPDCEADEEDGEYEVANFSTSVELLCDSGNRRRRCGRGKCAVMGAKLVSQSAPGLSEGERTWLRS